MNWLFVFLCGNHWAVIALDWGNARVGVCKNATLVSDRTTFVCRSEGRFIAFSEGRSRGSAGGRGRGREGAIDSRYAVGSSHQT